MRQQKLLLVFFLAILFFALPGQAQTVVFGDEATHFYEFTVATRPAAPPVGWVIVVTDGLTGADCTVGAGASRALCRWTGAVWEPLGGGGGGSATAIQYLGADPGAPANGDVWINSTTGLFKEQIGGTTKSFYYGGYPGGIAAGDLPNCTDATTPGKCTVAPGAGTSPSSLT